MHNGWPTAWWLSCAADSVKLRRWTICTIAVNFYEQNIVAFLTWPILLNVGWFWLTLADVSATYLRIVYATWTLRPYPNERYLSLRRFYKNLHLATYCSTKVRMSASFSRNASPFSIMPWISKNKWQSLAWFPFLWCFGRWRGSQILTCFSNYRTEILICVFA